MLTSLSIKNFILIEYININFQNGFSVITGETGAGKSIIIDALSLLTGKRTDSSVIRKNEQKCVIEASFVINDNLKAIFENEEIDFCNPSTIRREINDNGKSRAFINDSLVNLNKLELISKYLFHLHSQNENSNIVNSIYRLNFIDNIADSEKILYIYQSNFSLYNSLINTLNDKIIVFKKLKDERDYNSYQLQQFENANLQSDNELDDLENLQSFLENAEDIKKDIFQVLSMINYSDNSSLLDSVKEILSVFSRLSKNYKPAENYLERFDQINEEVKDIFYSLEKENDKLEVNPQELEKTLARIDVINNLLVKHNCKNISELKQKQLTYRKAIESTEDIEQEIDILKKQISAKESELIEIANELTKKRTSVFSNIEREINKLLSELGIPYGVFKIENQKSEKFSANGYDNINFLFSANKDFAPDYIEKVASGGEFSRLMLALNVILAKSKSMTTIVFDEIDSGVSGEIASKMGKMMKQISNFSQVISITHLPQVAAIGDSHYNVVKTFNNNQTVSEIVEISNYERINVIAAMISGEKMTKEAIENAKILLKK